MDLQFYLTKQNKQKERTIKMKITQILSFLCMMIELTYIALTVRRYATAPRRSLLQTIHHSNIILYFLSKCILKK